jgi:hypothetical protein
MKSKSTIGTVAVAAALAAALLTPVALSAVVAGSASHGAVKVSFAGKNPRGQTVPFKIID